MSTRTRASALGAAAARWREKMGWTREQMAQRTNIPAPWLARLEQGHLTQAEDAVSRFRTVAAAFGFSLTGFLREAGLVEPDEVEPSGSDPVLRELTANYSALSAEERAAVDTLIKSLARKP